MMQRTNVKRLALGILGELIGVIVLFEGASIFLQGIGEPQQQLGRFAANSSEIMGGLLVVVGISIVVGIVGGFLKMAEPDE